MSSHAPVGGAGPSVRLGRLGASAGAAFGLAVNDPAPRSATETTNRRAEGRLMIRCVPFVRPLLDALTVRKGPRKGERYANVRPEVRERLELLGRERALIYKTLVLTGLRRGELASLSVAQLHLDD